MCTDVVLSVSAAVMLGVTLDMLPNGEILVISGAVIDSNCVVKAAFAVDAFTSMWAGLVIDCAPGIDIDVNARISAVVKAALGVASPTT